MTTPPDDVARNSLHKQSSLQNSNRRPIWAQGQHSADHPFQNVLRADIPVAHASHRVTWSCQALKKHQKIFAHKIRKSPKHWVRLVCLSLSAGQHFGFWRLPDCRTSTGNSYLLKHGVYGRNRTGRLSMEINHSGDDVSTWVRCSARSLRRLKQSLDRVLLYQVISWNHEIVYYCT